MRLKRDSFPKESLMDIFVSLTLLSFFIETKALQSELMENKLGKNLCQ